MLVSGDIPAHAYSMLFALNVSSCDERRLIYILDLANQELTAQLEQATGNP
jgi:hypothetical protein